jgi:hypothetical protein
MSLIDVQYCSVSVLYLVYLLAVPGEWMFWLIARNRQGSVHTVPLAALVCERGLRIVTKTEYAEYLASSHWKILREQAIASAPFCWRCELPRWLAVIAYDQDLHVHHSTYERLGRELPEDLEVLCRRCHEIEGFGRSDLRAPKDSFCRICSERHWNPRSEICDHCDRCISEAGHRYFCLYLNEPLPGYEPLDDGSPVTLRTIVQMELDGVLGKRGEPV